MSLWNNILADCISFGEFFIIHTNWTIPTLMPTLTFVLCSQMKIFTRLVLYKSTWIFCGHASKNNTKNKKKEKESNTNKQLLIWHTNASVTLVCTGKIKFGPASVVFMSTGGSCTWVNWGLFERWGGFRQKKPQLLATELFLPNVLFFMVLEANISRGVIFQGSAFSWTTLFKPWSSCDAL